MKKATQLETFFNDLNKDLSIQAKSLIVAFGGEENIVDIDACLTRLRVQVEDVSKVKKDVITDYLGAAGIIDNDKLLHALYGVKSIELKAEMNVLLDRI